MNSLDAIIAIAILLGSMGILLGGLSVQAKSIEDAGSVLKARTNALECMALVDGFYANSADAYSGETECFAKEGRVIGKANGIDKSASVIPQIKYKYFLEVETCEHYR